MKVTNLVRSYDFHPVLLMDVMKTIRDEIKYFTEVFFFLSFDILIEKEEND